MIISNNRNPSLAQFKSLVDTATERLNFDSKKRPQYYTTRNAQLLEDDVTAVLRDTAIGTPFSDSIVKISGQRFPDIVAAKYYGVEVKSSKDDKWISLGGSVNESSRVEGVERIFLTFGKLVMPIEFKSRPYEECLSEVVATHYPRYKIDMNLRHGETIFDKMRIGYDELRRSNDTVGNIIRYYKSQLKKGESLWWIDIGEGIEENVTATMKVRLWSSLGREEKLKLTTSLFALFPDVLSTVNNRKYNRAVLWLASRHGVVDPSFRDKFSAGGVVDITTSRGKFKDLPQVFTHIHDFADDILELIDNTPAETLQETWQVKTVDHDRISQWIDLVSEKHISTNYSVNLILRAIFSV